MENFVAQMLSRFESGKINRRQLIGSITMAATALGTGGVSAFAQATAAAGAQTPPARVRTPAQDAKTKELLDARKVAPAQAMQVLYVRYTCSDYRISRDFYEEVMAMHRVPGSDNGSQIKMAFYPKGVAPIGQPAGTPSQYILMRNGFTPPAPAPAAVPGAPAPARPKAVNPGHIAYTIQLDNAMADKTFVWGRDTEMVRNPDKTFKLDADGKQIPNTGGPFQIVKKILTDRGLSPRKDMETSFHINDPQGFDLQICGVGMNGYEG